MHPYLSIAAPFDRAYSGIDEAVDLSDDLGDATRLRLVQRLAKGMGLEVLVIVPITATYTSRLHALGKQVIRTLQLGLATEERLEVGDECRRLREEVDAEMVVEDLMRC
jgi:hypothetical protein